MLHAAEVAVVHVRLAAQYVKPAKAILHRRTKRSVVVITFTGGGFIAPDIRILMRAGNSVGRRLSHVKRRGWYTDISTPDW